MPRAKPRSGGGRRSYGSLPYSLDRTLVERVKQYLQQLGDSAKYVELDELADHLQTQHTEYRRKKRLPFRVLVQRAYEVVATEMKDQFATSSSGSETDTEGEQSEAQREQNAINNSLTELYNKMPTIVAGKQVTPAPVSAAAEEIILDRTGSGRPEGDAVPPDLPESNEKQPDKPPPPPSAKTSKASKRRETATEPENEGFKRRRTYAAEQSTVDFNDVGGNDPALIAICELLEDFLDPSLSSDKTAAYSRGVLLHGPPGCGKSLVAAAVAGELGLPLIQVASTELVSGVSGDSEERIRELFQQARRAAPCVLFIDEIDALTSRRQTAQKEMERRIVSQLISSFDQLARSGASVLVVGATNMPDQIDPALRRANRFDQEVPLGIPNAAGRLQILQVLCRDLRKSEDVDLRSVARQTPGCVGADLRALITETIRLAKKRTRAAAKQNTQTTESGQNVVMESAPSTPSAPVTMDTEEAGSAGGVPRDPKLVAYRDQLQVHLADFHQKLSSGHTEEVQVCAEDFAAALKKIQPSSLREGFITVPNVTWADVGALHNVRDELEAEILDPVRDPDYYESLGLTSPSGILLCGPPGCGKTLLAKAVANEAGINFISVKGPELFNMYVGESERAVRQVFSRAKNSAPCVIFFDEIDSICQKRASSGGESGGSGARVVNQLLTEMDGMETRLGVYLMAATNRPELVDPAILRPGRIDKLLYVGLPTAADRGDILRAVTRSGTRPRLAGDVDLAVVAADLRCEGMTGADLTSLVRQAARLTAKQRLPEVHGRHFDEAFAKVRPSVRPADRVMYEQMRQFCANRDT